MRIKLKRGCGIWGDGDLSLCTYGVKEWFYVPRYAPVIWLRIEKKTFAESYCIHVCGNSISILDSNNIRYFPFTTVQQYLLSRKLGDGTFYLGVEYV